MLDERGLRDVIESRTVNVRGEEIQLRLVGLSETPNHAVMLAIAVGGTDERLQMHLSDHLRCDPIALRLRVVYFARRILYATRSPVNMSGGAAVERSCSETYNSPRSLEN